MNKKIKLIAIIGVAALLATENVFGQALEAPPSPADPTNAPAPTTPPSAGATKAASLLDDLKHLGSDAFGALKGANFGNGVTVEPFGLYHSGDFGGGLAVETSSTNGVNVGFAVAALSSKANKSRHFDFYDATLSIQLGRQVTVPILNIPAYLYVEVGPALNLSNPDTVLEQSIAGAKIFFAKGKGSVGAGVGQNSEWPNSPFYVAHFSWTF